MQQERTQRRKQTLRANVQLQEEIHMATIAPPLEGKLTKLPTIHSWIFLLDAQKLGEEKFAGAPSCPKAY